LAEIKDKNPSTEELTPNSTFAGVVGSLPNPDVILRKAGISTTVYDEMLFDPQIFSAYQKRKRKIQRLKYIVEGEDKEIVDFVVETIDYLNMKNLIVGMVRAIPHGFSVAEIMWENYEGKWIPVELKNRSNQKFEFNELSQLTYESQEGMVVAPYGKFVLHRNDYDDAGNPYGTSLNSRCYWYWRFKKHGWKVWGLYLEKYGDPALVLKSEETDEEKIKELLVKLDSVSSGSNMVIGSQESVDAISIPNAGSIGYADYTKEADKQIAKIYLGSSLLMDETSTGTYATSVEHGNDLDDIIISDATSIAESIRDYLLKPMIYFNYGEDREVPFIKFYSDAEMQEQETQGGTEEEVEKEEEVKKEEEKTEASSKNISENFFFDDLTVEQFAELPVYKQTLEKLSSNLEIKQIPIFDEIKAFKSYSKDPQTAFFQLQNFYSDTLDKIHENLGYAMFFVKMYAKLNSPTYKASFISGVKDIFATSKIEDAIIQPYEEVRKLFKSKIVLTDEEYLLLVNEAKNDAFSISGYKSKQVLNALKDMLEQMIIDGEGEAVWKKKASELLDSYGMSTTKAHLGNVYRTNLYSEYAKAGYKEYEKVKDEFPALMYDAIGDARTRPTHLALDGKIFWANDPIWDTIYPPNGYNCRCSVIPMSQKKLSGVEVQNGADYTGEKYAPDDGWDYHSGRDYKPEPKVIYDKDANNTMTYSEFGLPDNLEPVKKSSFSSVDDVAGDVLGGDVKIDSDVEDIDVIRNILSKPQEVWIYSMYSKSKNLVHKVNYVKSFIDGDTIESFTVSVDSRGNFISLSKMSKKDRSGFPIYVNEFES